MANLTQKNAAVPSTLDRRRPNREGNFLLKPSTLLGSNGHVSLLEEMMQSHMRIATRVMDLEQMVAAQRFDVEPPDNPTPAELRHTALTESLVRNMRQDVVNDYGDMPGSIAKAMSGVWVGNSVAEMSLYADPTSEFGARLEVYDIAVATISEWKREDRKYTGIYQRNVSESAWIPMEDLAICTWLGPFPTGTPRLRPAVFLYNTVKTVVFSFSEVARAAAGMLVVDLEEANSTDQVEEAIALIAGFDEGPSLRGVAIGGRTGIGSAKLEYPSNVFDPTVFLSYYDAQIDQLTSVTLQSLGLTAGSGSRALGDSLTVSDDAKWRASLQLVADKWSKQVFGWIARRAGYTGRLPTLTVPQADMPVDPSEQLDLIAKARELGAISQEEARKEARKVLGFDAEDLTAQ